MLAIRPWLRVSLFVVALAPHAVAQSDSPSTAVPSDAGQAKFTQGRITAGSIDLRRFLQIVEQLADGTIILPSATGSAEEVKFELLSPIAPFTFDVARAFLRANAYELVRTDAADGSGVVYELKRLAGNPARSPSSTDAVPPYHPVITRASDLNALDSRWVVTFVATLEHLTTADVLPVVRDLFESTQDSELTFVEGTPQSLVVRADVETIRHVEQVIDLIDQPTPSRDARLYVRELQHADAVETVETLRTALEARAARKVRRLSGEPGTTPTPSTGPPQVHTSLIPDARTQKILIHSSDPHELDLVLALIEELDLKSTRLLGDTHIYEAKYLKASSLYETVQQLIEGTPLAERYRLFPHDDSNSIIIRGASEGRLELLNYLIESDHEAAAEAGPPQARLYDARRFALTHVSSSIVANVLNDYLREVEATEGEVFTRVVSVPGRRMLVFRSPSRARIAELENLARAFDDPRFQLGIYDELILWKTKRPAAEVAVELEAEVEKTEFPVAFRLASAHRIAVRVDRELRPELAEILFRLDRKKSD